MNKTEIIRRVAFSNASNAPRPSVAEPTEADNAKAFEYAFNVALARACQEALTEALSDLGEAPDATLLRRLHEAYINHSELSFTKLKTHEHHEAMYDADIASIKTITMIAKELGIEYETPNDRFVQ